jgi:hypothetical protein
MTGVCLMTGRAESKNVAGDSSRMAAELVKQHFRLEKERV